MAEGLIIAVVFGLIYGSFLNVVILRFDDWKSIATTRSHCPTCQKQLSWWDLVPIFSFAFLGGKCRYCKKPISWQYPIVELATALLIAGSTYLTFFGAPLALWQSIVGLALLVVATGAMVTIFVHDLLEMMVPDLMSYILIGAALLYRLVVSHDYLGLVYAALIGFIPIMLLVYPSRGKLMGEGDIKLSGALAILVGWPNAVTFFVLTFIIGGAFGAIGLATKQFKMKTAIPFGPFLIIGAIIALFWGDAITAWYLGTIGYGYY